MNQLIINFIESAYPSFDSFLGKANSELIYLLKNKVSNLTYVWGDIGCGKSHLLRAWVQNFNLDGKSAVYLNKEIINFKKYVTKDIDYIAVDDVNNLNKEQLADLFNIFNDIKVDKKKYFLASGLYPPKQLDIRNDLKTRLGLCLVYKVNSLTDEEKIITLQKIVELRQMNVDDSIFLYLIQRGNRDFHNLVNIILDLDAYSIEKQRKITIPLIKKFLKEKINE